MKKKQFGLLLLPSPGFFAFCSDIFRLASELHTITSSSKILLLKICGNKLFLLLFSQSFSLTFIHSFIHNHCSIHSFIMSSRCQSFLLASLPLRGVGVVVVSCFTTSGLTNVLDVVLNTKKQNNKKNGFHQHSKVE